MGLSGVGLSGVGLGGVGLSGVGLGGVGLGGDRLSGLFLCNNVRSSGSVWGGHVSLTSTGCNSAP